MCLQEREVCFCLLCKSSRWRLHCLCGHSMVSSSTQALTVLLFLPSACCPGPMLTAGALAVIIRGSGRVRKAKNKKRWPPKDEPVFFKQLFPEVPYYPWTWSNVHSLIDVAVFQEILCWPKKVTFCFLRKRRECRFWKALRSPCHNGNAGYCSGSLVKPLSFHMPTQSWCVISREFPVFP